MRRKTDFGQLECNIFNCIKRLIQFFHHPKLISMKGLLDNCMISSLLVWWLRNVTISKLSEPSPPFCSVLLSEIETDCHKNRVNIFNLNDC